MIRKRFRRRKLLVIDVIGDSPAVYDYLTVPLFQANAATGTMSMETSIRINDNATDVSVFGGGVDQYTEVDFGKKLLFKQYRQFGNINNNGSGRWKIQYWNGSAWADWVAGIAASVNGNWETWVTDSTVFADKIRLVCTVVDTEENWTRMQELEMKY